MVAASKRLKEEKRDHALADCRCDPVGDCDRRRSDHSPDSVRSRHPRADHVHQRLARPDGLLTSAETKQTHDWLAAALGRPLRLYALLCHPVYGWPNEPERRLYGRDGSQELRLAGRGPAVRREGPG